MAELAGGQAMEKISRSRNLEFFPAQCNIGRVAAAQIEMISAAWACRRQHKLTHQNTASLHHFENSLPFLPRNKNFTAKYTHGNHIIAIQDVSYIGVFSYKSATH